MNAQNQEPGTRVHGNMPFVHAVAATVTWKKFLYVQSLALAWGLLRGLEMPPAHEPPYWLIGCLLITNLGAMLIMLAALCADEAVNRGVPGRRAYPLALLLAISAAGILQWYVRAWLDILPLQRVLPPFEEEAFGVALAALDVGIIGGIAMLVYVNRRKANRILEGVRDTELKRVQLERQLVDSRLAATQAQIDPRELFAALADIKARYQIAAPDADEKLDGLIQRLRIALARTVAVGSSVAVKP